MNLENEIEVQEMGSLLLEIGSLLMSNGASTARVRITIDRIAGVFGYTADLFVTHRALTLSLTDNNNEKLFNSLKRTSPHGVNFRMVSGISRMSWSIVEEKWSMDQIRLELERLQALPHFSRWIVLCFVSLAGASFCRLAGGSPLEMFITYIATFAGLFVRQETHKHKYNSYLCVFFGALTASMVAGFFTQFNFSEHIEHAFATSVLFLIPGIPLINTFTDLIDGNILNGMIRWVHGLIISFMIALGLMIAIYIYQI